MRRANLLAPVTPSKIICVGRNYRDHAKELATMCQLSRSSFSNAFVAAESGSTVLLPAASTRVDLRAS